MNYILGADSIGWRDEPELSPGKFLKEGNTVRIGNHLSYPEDRSEEDREDFIKRELRSERSQEIKLELSRFKVIREDDRKSSRRRSKSS